MEIIDNSKETEMSDKKIQTHEINNFIGIFDNYFPDITIDATLKWFEQEEKKKRVMSRLQSEKVSSNIKSDQSCVLRFNEHDGWLQEIPGLAENLMTAINIYLEEVPLKEYVETKELEFNNMKIQKTSPGGGYHVWHVEACYTLDMLKRVLVFTVYLNDIEEGGETEFLYQNVRVKPVKGRVVIWPAYFPYVHRGNPPLKNDKYILTSWLSGRFLLR